MAVSTENLKNKLTEAMDDYAREIDFLFSGASQGSEIARKDDLHELAKQTFYLFGRFRDEIISYLKKL